MGLFSFLGSAISSAVKIVSGGTINIGGGGKKAAQIAADDAAKQRAHELQVLAQQKQMTESKSKLIMTMGLIGGAGLLGFMFLRKR